MQKYELIREMKKLWIDPDLLENKSGIGRDAQNMLYWLNANFESEIVKWPFKLHRKRRIRRRSLMVLNIVFGAAFHLPNSYKGAFYQSQLGPLLPGKEIGVWIIRLHDLFPATNPEWFWWWSNIVFKRSLAIAVKRKAIFLCDSVATEDAVKKLYAGETLNTYVIPCQLPQPETTKCGTCDACLNPQNSEADKFFLSVGTIEPRKNYSLALSVWREFALTSQFIPKLIIVGRPGWKTARIQRTLRQTSSKHVTWFSNCCDGALEELYAGCKALISFSLAEGFDFPPMEARQRHQKPLILSDIPVHREFHEGSAMFFTQGSELLRILNSPLPTPAKSDYSSSTVDTLNQITKSLKSSL